MGQQQQLNERGVKAQIMAWTSYSQGFGSTTAFPGASAYAPTTITSAPTSFAATMTLPTMNSAPVTYAPTAISPAPITTMTAPMTYTTPAPAPITYTAPSVEYISPAPVTYTAP